MNNNEKLSRNKPQSSRLAYPVSEACYLLGIGRTSLYDLAKHSEIKLIKISGRTLVPHTELERLVKMAGPSEQSDEPQT